MADWLPIISQLKSGVQAVCGDLDGARRTQVNFTKQCPVVSQVRSVCESFAGDEEAAWNTQKEFLQTVNGVVDSVPLVGHAKGVIHYACGDREGGDNAMKASSRTTGVLAAGAGGFLLGGPVGAVAAGIGGGMIMDDVTTVVDSKVHGKFKPAGYLQQLDNIVENPKDPGTWFDTGFMFVGDGATGYAGGKAAKNLQKFTNQRNIRLEFEAERQLIVDEVGKAAAKDMVEAADRMKSLRVEYDIPEKKPHITAVANDIEAKQLYEGHNKQIRTFTRTKAIVEAGGESSYSCDVEPTRVQNRFPVKEPLARDGRTCAEHRSMHKLLKEKPNADPGKVRVSSVRFDKSSGTIRAVEGCKNCKTYSEGRWSAPGDKINGMKVPNHPGIGKYSYHKEIGKAANNAGKGALLRKNQLDDNDDDDVDDDDGEYDDEA